MISKVEDGELRVDGDPEMENSDRSDNNDENHPRPISNVKSDEQIGGRDRTRSYCRSKFDPTKVEGAARDRDREGEDEIRNKETDDRLIKSVEHVHEELGSVVLLSSDTSSIQLRDRLASFRADILIKLSSKSQRLLDNEEQQLTIPSTATGSEVKTRLKSMMSE